MKKNLSLAGYSLVALGLVMGSCVSKRKYMEAQTSAAERYRTDSTEWANRSTTMQQNVTSLEQKNTTYQRQLDSLRNASATYQKHWDNLQTSYTTTSEQVHQQIHAAIDQYVEAENVQLQNGKVYVNLPEKMLFNAGSSTLSTKGKQALDKLAEVLAANENVEVDIIATSAYYNNGSSTSGTGTTGTDNLTGNNRTGVTGSETTGTPTTGSETATTGSGSTTDANTAGRSTEGTANKGTSKDKNATAKGSSTAKNKTATNDNQGRANVGDSSYPGSGSVTDRSTQQDPNKKSQGTTKTSTTKKTTTSTAKSNKSKQGDQSMSFKSSPKSSRTTASTAPNWNLNVARSTAIVRELTQNGLQQARIILAGQNAKGITTNDWATTNRGYQIVVSPRMDYQQMMQQGQGTGSGQGTTSMK